MLTSEALSSKLAKANRFLFVTGAGMGVASGLKTFRGSDGYYKNYSFEQLASRSGFDIHPELTWDWYNERFEHYRDAEPNAGHHAIVEFEKLPINVEVATQNVDGLHIRAGSKRVYELHGNLRFIRCTGCEASAPMTAPFDTKNLYHSCGVGKLRPNIVWFGENLPDGPFHASAVAAMDADVIVVAGTSSQVFPSAGLIDQRKDEAIVVEVNPNPAIAHKVDFVIAEGTEVGIPKLLKMTQEAKG